MLCIIIIRNCVKVNFKWLKTTVPESREAAVREKGGGGGGG